VVEAFHAKNFVGNRAALVGVGIDHARLVKYADILQLQKGAGKIPVNIYNATYSLARF
jgi:predicted Zn-dependent peptidase